MKTDIYLEFKHTIKNDFPDYPQRKFLLAVSGGVDSIVLFNLFNRLRKSEGVEFAIANIDHQLRKESASESEFVKKNAELADVPFFGTTWKHDDKTTEAEARNFRYDFFKQIMDNNYYDILVTAHHADDQAETILMKLIRNGSIYSVQGMETIRNFYQYKLWRPFLKFSKTELIDYAHGNDLAFVEDKSNFDGFTFRNRLRQNVIPELKNENPNFLEHVNLFATELQAANNLNNQYFNRIMENDFSDDLKSGDLNSLKELSKEQMTLFWTYYKQKNQKYSLKNRQIQSIVDVIMDDSLHGEVSLGDREVFVKQNNKFAIKRSDELLYKNSIDEYLIELNKEYTINDKKFLLSSDVESSGIIISTDKIPSEILLRSRRPGDKVELKNNQHQKLKSRMINQKIPFYERNELLVLLFDNQIVWVENVYALNDYLLPGDYSAKIVLKKY